MVRKLILALVAVPLAAGEKPKLSFVKDIVPIFTKSGCANSNCHGSIRGQAGFKLSLFGYEPDLDYEAIVKAQDGRRIDRKEPAKSLILMKPTFSTPHGGGERFKIASLEYDAILQWIADGATYDSAGRSDAGWSGGEAAAFRFGHLHRWHDRRPDPQGPVHRQR